VPNLKRYYDTYTIDLVDSGVKNLTHTVQSSDTGLSFYDTLITSNVTLSVWVVLVSR